jgi:hypothetical protein
MKLLDEIRYLLGYKYVETSITFLIIFIVVVAVLLLNI